MSKSRLPAVPRIFSMHCATKSKADLIEVLWDLLMESSWFDEMRKEAYHFDPKFNAGVPFCQRIDEIITSYREQRK